MDMFSSAKFYVGDIVKDRLSGYKGEVQGITRSVDSAYRYILQAEGKNTTTGLPHEKLYFDEGGLSLVKAGKKPRYPDVVMDFKLGDIVTDIYKERSGFASAITLWIEGCVNVLIEYEAKGDRKGETETCSLRFVKLKKARDLFPEVKPVHAPIKTGGPNKHDHVIGARPRVMR